MSAENPNPPAINKQKPVVPPTELIQAFLSNQGKELELKSQELVLKQQADHHSFEYAKTALTVEQQDREASRRHSLSTQKLVLSFAFAIFASGACFLGFAIYSGKDAIAMEIIKATIFLVSGGSGGYAIGKSRKKGKDSDNSGDEDDDD